jgi:hypothetical protein
MVAGMNFTQAAMDMLKRERVEQNKAHQREYVAWSRATAKIITDDPDAGDAKRKVKRWAAGERAACQVMPRLRRKKNRAERIAARLARS